MKNNVLALILVAGIPACATYQPLPIPTAPQLATEVPHLLVQSTRMPPGALASHPFDPADGLDMTETAMLAVANNPALKVARSEAGVATAQAFASGLLPDPQLSFSQDLHTTDSAASVSAFSVGLSYDVNALLTRSTAKNAAEATLRQTDLNLLWQEWQVVSQARLIFARSVGQQQLLSVLQKEHDLLLVRYQRTQSALKSGNLTLDAVNGDLAALQTLETSMNDLDRQINSNQQDLNALLGLAPEARVHLVGEAQLSSVTNSEIATAVQQIAQRRPDLLALEAGYESQELHFRQSILAQFPALNIGLTHSRDSAGLFTQGLGITLSLPIFNRNRGNIAIEEATRQRLRDEYQMRLNGAAADIARVVQDEKLLDAQLHNVESGLGVLAPAAARSQTAFDTGNIDILTYTNFHTAWLAKQAEAITLRQTLQEQRITLLTLIGGEFSATRK